MEIKMIGMLAQYQTHHEGVDCTTNCKFNFNVTTDPFEMKTKPCDKCIMFRVNKTMANLLKKYGSDLYTKGMTYNDLDSIYRNDVRGIAEYYLDKYDYNAVTFKQLHKAIGCDFKLFQSFIYRCVGVVLDEDYEGIYLERDSEYTEIERLLGELPIKKFPLLEELFNYVLENSESFLRELSVVEEEIRKLEETRARIKKDLEGVETNSLSSMIRRNKSEYITETYRSVASGIPVPPVFVEEDRDDMDYADQDTEDTEDNFEDIPF